MASPRPVHRLQPDAPFRHAPDHDPRRDGGGHATAHAHEPRENVTRALYNDWEWWSDNGEEMNERFSTWLAR